MESTEANLNQSNQNSSIEQYENVISLHLPDYVNGDLLFSFTLPAIHRIVTKYQLNQESYDQNKIINFLFKCLDKYGRDASVLFEKIDFSRENASYLQKLVTEYSEIFDFHFINKAYHKTLYDMQSEIIQKETSINLQEEKIYSLIQNENIQLRNEIKEIKEKQDQVIRSNDLVIKQMSDSYLQQFNAFKVQIRQMTETMAQQNNLISQMKAQIDRLMKPNVSCYFHNESNPSGIVGFLNEELFLSAGGNGDNKKYPITNIKYNDNRYFRNYKDNYKTNKLENSWIEFDFGVSTRVDLHSYLIRSSECYESDGFHPKSWRIEGSNNKVDWVLLDKRVNDNNLNGYHKQHHFICNENKFGKQDCRFKFIRYIQDDCWCQKMRDEYQNPYNIFIQYFELYGDICY